MYFQILLCFIAFFRISDFLSVFRISLSLMYLYYHICRFLSSGKVNIFSIVFSSIFLFYQYITQYQHDNPNYHKKGKCYVDQTSQNYPIRTRGRNIRRKKIFVIPQVARKASPIILPNIPNIKMINNSVSINCHLVFFSGIIQYGLPFTVINDLMGIFTSNKEKIYKQRKKPPAESFRKGRLFTIRLYTSLKP